MAELDQRRARAVANPGLRPRRERQRARERLAPVSEGVVDESPQRRIGARSAPLEADQDRIDVRHRAKDGPGDAAQDLDLAGELGEHARDPVRAGPGRGGEPLANLALDHHQPPLEIGKLVDRAQDRGRGDAVGQVRDDFRRLRPQSGEVELERVGHVQGDVGELVERRAELGLEASIDLDDVKVARPLRQALREDAAAAADLEHDVSRVESREALDHVEQIAVDEEVLAQLAGPPGAHQPNSAAAVRSI